MKTLFRKLHLWLSLPVGLVIKILCLTGAILVFQQPMLEYLNPDKYFVKEVADQPLSISLLMEKATEQVSDTIELSSITVQSENNRNYTLGIKGVRRGGIAIDPYTGTINNEEEKGKEFFNVILRLHRWLLFPVKRGEFSFGKFLTGSSTLLFFFILITGIVIWVPKSLKLLKQRLRIKTGKGTYRLWYDTHLAGGIYASIILIALCLTGLTWSFDWYRSGFYAVFGVESNSGHGPANNSRNEERNQEKKAEEGNSKWQDHQKQRNSQETRSYNKNEVHDAHEDFKGSRRNHSINDSTKRDKNSNHFFELQLDVKDNSIEEIKFDYSVWDKVLNNLHDRNISFEKITLENGTAAVYNNPFKSRASDKYTFDSHTGEITEVKYYNETATPAEELRSWIYMIHVGKWGGIITQILTFVAAVIGVLLPITGYYLYFKRVLLKR
nr:PepSY-associated TM helix domain-containing protein [uncultured Carboxylicivirga sp.]